MIKMQNFKAISKPVLNDFKISTGGLPVTFKAVFEGNLGFKHIDVVHSVERKMRPMAC